jgi:hypothetical protein
MDVDKVVNVINQLRKLTGSGKRRLPKVVNEVNTQNLVKKEKPSIRDPVNKLSTEMVIYCSIFYLYIIQKTVDINVFTAYYRGSF